MEKTKKTAILIATILGIITALSINTYSQGSAIAEGGNVTPLNLTLLQGQTQRWQGIPGRLNFIGPDAPSEVNATGGEVNYTQINVTSPCTNPTVTGFILFSNSSTLPTGLTAGNLTQLDNFVAAISGDSATNTFKYFTTFTINGVTINNAPTTYTNVNNILQNNKFREGYLNDANGNLVFAVEVELNTQGYNTSYFDFQAILPTDNKTTTEYYLTTALTLTCPGQPSTGGGGGNIAICISNWVCTNWTECIDGIQYRNCTPTSPCGRHAAYPSLSKKCPETQRAATEIQEIIEEIKQKTINIKLPEINAISGLQLDIPIQLQNPYGTSIEQIEIKLEAPITLQPIIPLHQKPIFYIFGMKPLMKTKEQTEWIQKHETFRLNPDETKTTILQTRIPLITPQTIDARININSGEITIASIPIKIKIETEPFTLIQEKDGQITHIEMLIDNRNKPEHKANIELNLNKGRTTKISEIYTVTVPENKVAIYGYDYQIKTDYEKATATYKKIKTEAIPYVHIRN